MFPVSLLFRLKSVTIFCHVKEHQHPSQNCACRFPAHSSSVELTSRTTVCKYTIHATRSVPAKNIVTLLPSPLRYEGNIVSVMLSISEYGIRLLIPLHFAARPFECPELTGLGGHYPICNPNMTWSDCHTAILPSSPLRLVGSFFGNGMALPSSAVNR